MSLSRTLIPLLLLSAVFGLNLWLRQRRLRRSLETQGRLKPARPRYTWLWKLLGFLCFPILIFIGLTIPGFDDFLKSRLFPFLLTVLVPAGMILWHALRQDWPSARARRLLLQARPADAAREQLRQAAELLAAAA